jgi:hypothetical protein
MLTCRSDRTPEICDCRTFFPASTRIRRTRVRRAGTAPSSISARSTKRGASRRATGFAALAVPVAPARAIRAARRLVAWARVPSRSTSGAAGRVRIPRLVRPRGAVIDLARTTTRRSPRSPVSSGCSRRGARSRRRRSRTAARVDNCFSSAIASNTQPVRIEMPNSGLPFSSPDITPVAQHKAPKAAVATIP